MYRVFRPAPPLTSTVARPPVSGANAMPSGPIDAPEPGTLRAKLPAVNGSNTVANDDGCAADCVAGICSWAWRNSGLVAGSWLGSASGSGSPLVSGAVGIEPRLMLGL